MNKPNNYDATQAQGEFVPVEVGGHYCLIKKVMETKTKNGDDMIIVAFDFAPNDRQPGYFTEAFRNDIREDKRWPFQGTKYIVVNDYNDKSKTSKAFKTFCTSVEKSNSGFAIQWGDNWGNQFTNKKVGVVYGLEENEYNGNSSMRPAVKWFCKWEAVESAAVPAPKYLKKSADVSTTFTAMNDDTSDIPF